MNNPLRLEQIKNPIIRWGVKKISKIDAFEAYYDAWLEHNNNQHGHITEFMAFLEKRLDVKADIYNKELLDSIPRTGQFIVVANHPLGGIESLLLINILLKIRPDLKVLANKMLKIFPQSKDFLIGVDVINKDKQRENAEGMREASRHLSGGGAMLVFPAGMVSQIKLPSMHIVDPPWSPMITRLARKYDAPIMPIFVGGRNSIWFYLSGYVHKRLRTMLLPREMVNKGGESIPLHIGETIPVSDIHRLNKDEIATCYIRLCCKVLKESSANEPEKESLHMNAIKNDVAADIVSAHLQSLEHRLICDQDKFACYCVPYDELGPVMEQLAIEREHTFRGVDEGTGRELDSDYFDPHYWHLFLWDKEKQKIAGGYRIGITNDIIKDQGLGGLYSHSLFKYNQKFVEGMGSTIELGRSFVTPDYQRQPKALDMLWKGIGHFVAQNPQYHTLFGCVSISQQYSRLGSALLTETFLSHYGVENSIQRKVKARKPISNLETPWSKTQIKALAEIPVLNKLVGRIDTGKSIPVLIRHYLALNGRFVSFTVNEGFNHSLDGLIIVDLRNTDEKYLKRYMGAEGFEKFQALWADQKNAA